MELLYLATFGVALLSSILSGIAGGGGSYIMAPYWLITGMSPAQGATTGAFMALGMSGSSLAAFRGTKHMPNNKKLIGALLTMTLISSAVGPFFLQRFDTDTFKLALAVLTLVSLPLLFIDRKRLITSTFNQRIGTVFLGVVLLASSFITSAIFSILIAIILAQSFGFNTLQSTALRRIIGIVQSVVMFAILASLGNFVWPHALAGITGGIIGSFLGTKFAIKRGETFAKYALAVGAVISLVFLIL